MVDELKKILLAGIGSASYTYDKVSVIIEDLAAKGQLTLDQSKELSEELKRSVKETGDKIKPINKVELNSILDEVNYSIRQDIEEIKLRLDKIEDRINLISNKEK
jgi:polyhydroxyalkanoate synthesis regulator phasin